MDSIGDHKKGLENRVVLNASEVQQILGLSRGSVYQALATGEIPSIRIGRRILVPRALLERCLHGDSNRATDIQTEPSEP